MQGNNFKRYLPMKDTIAKVTPNDLHLLFQGKQLHFNISETLIATATCEMTLSTWL